MPIFRPSKPGLILTLASDTVVLSGAVIPYDTEQWEEGWTTWAAGVLTVPKPGTYTVSAWWSSAALVVSATRTIGLQVNGVGLFGSDRYPATTAAIRGTVHSIVRCAAGDTISVSHVHSAGLASTFTGTVNRLAVIRAGPERHT